jgi:hypothetical protein
VLALLAVPATTAVRLGLSGAAVAVLVTYLSAPSWLGRTGNKPAVAGRANA